MREGLISEHNNEIVRYFKEHFEIELKTKSSDPVCAVFGGGPDIDSLLYFEDKTHYGVQASAVRDLREMAIAMEARLIKLPCIGICRGAQLLHVANGGYLFQDVSEHRQKRHEIFDEGNQKVKLEVNSRHHQAIPYSEARMMYDDTLWSPAALGKSTVKICESFYDEARKQAAVQYHPESADCGEDGTKFFDSLVETILKEA